MQATKKVFTLGALGQALENHFLNEFGLRYFWVAAEIAKRNFKAGHTYLELADMRDGKMLAQMSAVIWAGTYQKIYKANTETLKDILKAGNKVLFQVKVDYHKVFGLKLVVQDIDPSYTFGEIEKRKQETIEALKKAGVFDEQKKLYFPVLSKRIALVGSPQTSGYRDFKDEIYNNSVYRKFKLKTFQTSVQGDKAKLEIVAAIEEARKYDVDVIVLIRGGGSKIDLDIFNDYDVCKSICETKIPIITGIGHETDRVVADLVAHQFFITPTAVAKHLYVQIGNFRHFLSKYYDQIKTKSLAQLGGAKDEFHYKNKYFVHYAQQITKDWAQVFNDKNTQINRLSREVLYTDKEYLAGQTYALQTQLYSLLNQGKQNIDLQTRHILHISDQIIQQQKEGVLIKTEDQLRYYSENIISLNKVNLVNTENILQLVNPLKLLSSGYTISTINEKDIDSLSTDLSGLEMKTLSSKYLIESKIISVKKLKINE